jgi:cation transport ATPase
MYRTTAEIKGMMCGMCEAHVQDAVRAGMKVKKVRASHTKNRLEIISEAPISEAELKSIIAPTGYEFVSSSCEEYEKKSLFSRKK